MFRPLLGVQMSFRVAGTRDCAPCQKWAKRETFEEDLERCISHGRLQYKRHVHQRYEEVRRWFPEKGCIRSLILGRWFCVTGAALRMTWLQFSRQARYFRDMDWKNPKTHWYQAVSSARNFPLLKAVSQNCFVFDVANLKNWGSLAELLRFWRYQIQKVEEVSQTCFVFDVVRFKTWGLLAE